MVSTFVVLIPLGGDGAKKELFFTVQCELTYHITDYQSNNVNSKRYIRDKD